jgi:transposase-like protein
MKGVVCPMMQAMTDDIKATLRAEIARQGKTMSEVAREIKTSRNQVSRMLSAKRKDSSGEIPDVWKDLLEHLGYELTLKTKEVKASKSKRHGKN